GPDASVLSRPFLALPDPGDGGADNPGSAGVLRAAAPEPGAGRGSARGHHPAARVVFPGVVSLCEVRARAGDDDPRAYRPGHWAHLLADPRCPRRAEHRAPARLALVASAETQRHHGHAVDRRADNRRPADA